MDEETLRVDAERALEAVLTTLPCNALAVTVYCMDAFFEARGIDMLPHAFDLFPDREYLVLTVPSAVQETDLLRHFTPIVGKPGATFSHALYVLHRDQLLALEHMVVERFNPKVHAETVQDIVDGMPKLKASLELSDRDAEVALSNNPNSVAFAMRIGSQCVGLATLNRKTLTTERLASLRANFEVDSLVAADRIRARAQAMLTGLVVNPAFAVFTRAFLLQAMRLYEKSIIYHEAGDMELVPRPLLEHMAPVKPRRRAMPLPGVAEKFPLESLVAMRAAGGRPSHTGGALSDGDGADAAETDASGGESVAVHLVTRQLLALPKQRINTRIVVIGHSACALSTLEHLLFRPDKHFTSITYVSPVGLVPRKWENKSSATGLLGVDHEEDYEPHVLAALGLSQRVRCIQTRVQHIDRQVKVVELESGAVLPYDKLVLADKFVDSTPFKLSKQANEADLRKGCLCVGDDVVSGVVSIDRNDRTETTDLARRLLATLPDDAPVVVYGASLEALSAVAWLLDQGLAASRITLLRPCWGGSYALTDPHTQFDGLGDHRAEQVASAALHKLGIEDKPDIRLVGVVGDESGNLLAIEVEQDAQTPRGQTERERIRCNLLLTYHQSDVRQSLFQAINESGIVYDGRLVVDERMRTSDPNIFAGGDLTKFSRKLRKPWPHTLHNPHEVARHLAACVLEVVESQEADDAQTIGRVKDAGSLEFTPPDQRGAPATAPQFTAPRAVSARLPGGLNHTRITCPKGKGLAQDSCTQLKTGPTNEDVDRFSMLVLDSFGRSVDFTYIGTECIEMKNFARLIGLQEAYLNSCHSAHNRELIQDWVAFFRGEWAHALYHDRFCSLVESLRGVLATDQGAAEILETLSRCIREGKDETAITGLRAQAVGPVGEGLMASTKKLIETTTMEFLQRNKNVLPEYHLPDGRSSHK